MSIVRLLEKASLRGSKLLLGALIAFLTVGEGKAERFDGEYCLQRVVRIQWTTLVPGIPGLAGLGPGEMVQLARIENLADQRVDLDIALHYRASYMAIGSAAKERGERERGHVDDDVTGHITLGPHETANRYPVSLHNIFHPPPEPETVIGWDVQPAIISSRSSCLVQSAAAMPAAPLSSSGSPPPIQEARARPYDTPPSEASVRQQKVQPKTNHGAKLKGEEIESSDGVKMILVQSGEYGRPGQTRNLPAFYMDKYEVSSKQYARFVQETAHKKPKDWSELSSSDNRPVVNVSWLDADEYCRHFNKRLPASEEWGKAAYGPEQYKYTWGNDKPATRQVLVNRKWEGYQTLAAVGSYEDDVSIYGVYDMMGSVSEWTSSGRGETKVIRGGSWAVQLSTDRFANYDFDQRMPGTWSASVGFRCVKD